MGSAYFWFIVWFFDKSWPLKPTNDVGWDVYLYFCIGNYLKMSLFIMLFLKVCFIFILTLKHLKSIDSSYFSILHSLVLLSMHISVQFYTYLSPVWCIFNCSFNAYFYAIFMHISAEPFHICAFLCIPLHIYPIYLVWGQEPLVQASFWWITL